MTESVLMHYGDVEKNKNEIIRVQKKAYKQNQFIDVRVYYKDRDTGEFKPTAKGVAIREGLLPDLIRLLVDVVDPPPTLKDVEMIQRAIKNHESDNA